MGQDQTHALQQSVDGPARTWRQCTPILKARSGGAVNDGAKGRFVGIRSNRLDETVALFRDVIGVPVTRQTDDLVGFKLTDGTVLELYGPTNEFHAFFTTGPVVAFRVDNFDVNRQAMLAAGVNFIGDVQHADGVSWQHFYCPDGTVLEISGTGDGASSPTTST
jgi:catechol 2,3-dioxygenase-like lactoylglutathione lyase family enzyme